ncbi:MAG: phosphate/phosphite/phosphonate ABC transporter substrate-binding protein [Polyangiales bacterium]
MVLRVVLPPSLGSLKANARAELLGEALTTELGELVLVDLARTYDDVAQRALRGRAHLVWAPAGVCPLLESTAHAMLKVVRHGRSTYRSALVCRRDDRETRQILRDVASDETRAATLSRRSLRAAWVDPLSLGGYVLACEFIRGLGVDPEHLFSSQRFYGSHPDALGALLARQADLSAVTVVDDDRNSTSAAFSMYVGLYARELEILGTTDAAPTDALVLTSALDAARAERIATRLLDSVAARAPSVLLAAMDAERFERARPGEYRTVRRLVREG